MARDEAMPISPVTEADLHSVANLAREIWYLHYPGIITVRQIDYMLAQRYQPSAIGSSIRAGDTWWDKLEVGSYLAGFTSYERGLDPSSIKLDKLYVHPSQQHRGFGYKLLRHVETQSRSRGYQMIYLQVNKENAASIAFYRRAGFTLTDHVKVDIGNNFFMDDFVFSRELVG